MRITELTRAEVKQAITLLRGGNISVELQQSSPRGTLVPQGGHHSHHAGVLYLGTWSEPPQALDTDQLPPNTTPSQLFPPHQGFLLPSSQHLQPHPELVPG